LLQKSFHPLAVDPFAPFTQAAMDDGGTMLKKRFRHTGIASKGFQTRD
jgi:hypothetical protein